VTLTNADLTTQSWPKNLSKTAAAIILTFAPHDLGGQKAVAEVYARCCEILPIRGVLVNVDFIKPGGTSWEYEPGPSRFGGTSNSFAKQGFLMKSLAHLEPKLKDLTPAQKMRALWP
jgi:hypothetical protein